MSLLNRLLGWVFFYFPIYSDLQKICIIKELFLLKNFISTISSYHPIISSPLHNYTMT